MIVPIVGVTGSGKTEIARRHVMRNLNAETSIVLIDDPNSQWTTEKLARSGFPGIYPSTIRDVDQLKAGGNRLMVRCVSFMPHQMIDILDYARAYHRDRDMESKPEDVIVVLDEVFRLSSPKRGFIGGEEGPFWDIVLNHRHYGIKLICCMQSFALADRRLYENADESYICFLRGTSSKKRLENDWGEEYVEALRELPEPRKGVWPLYAVKRVSGNPPEVVNIAEM